MGKITMRFAGPGDPIYSEGAVVSFGSIMRALAATPRTRSASAATAGTIVAFPAFRFIAGSEYGCITKRPLTARAARPRRIGTIDCDGGSPGGGYLATLVRSAVPLRGRWVVFEELEHPGEVHAPILAQSDSRPA